MLNDADGHGSGDAGEAVRDGDALFTRLKSQVKADYNSKGQVNWRREARDDFDFEAGEQLNETESPICGRSWTSHDASLTRSQRMAASQDGLMRIPSGNYSLI
jgi:hypothetical protein